MSECQKPAVLNDVYEISLLAHYPSSPYLQIKGEVGLPRWLSVKESACNAGDLTGDVGLRRRAWQPTSVLLPDKSLGQTSLVGCSL